MAGPGNQRCASCIGTLLFPTTSFSTKPRDGGEKLVQNNLFCVQRDVKS